MSLEFQVASLDEVGESLRPAYREAEDGLFRLDPDAYAEIKAQGLKNKNKELLGAQKKLKEDLSRFERFKDVQDEDWERFLAFREQGEQPNGKADAQPSAEELRQKWQQQFAEERKKIQAQHAQEVANLKAEFERLQSDLTSTKVQNRIRTLAEKAGVLPEAMETYLREVGPRFRLSENGRDVILLDEDGDPLETPPEKAIAEIFRESLGYMYAASGSQGSGAPAQNGRGGLVAAVTLSEKDAIDPAKYRAAAERAEKMGVPLRIAYADRQGF